MYGRIYYFLYRYARISAVHVKMEIVNTGTVPVTAAMCTLPWLDTPAGSGTPLGPVEAAEYPRAVTTQIGTNTGMSKGTIAKTFASFDQLGEPVYESRYWVDDTQALVTTPLDTREPVIYCVVDATDPTLEWSAQIVYTVTFHVQWFDLKRDTSDELLTLAESMEIVPSDEEGLASSKIPTKISVADSAKYSHVIYKKVKDVSCVKARK